MKNLVKIYNKNFLKKTLFIIVCAAVALGVFSALDNKSIASAVNLTNKDSGVIFYYDKDTNKVVSDGDLIESFYTDNYIENKGKKNEEIHENIILAEDKDYLYEGEIYVNNDGRELRFHTCVFVDTLCKLRYRVEIKWIDKDGNEEIESRSNTRLWFNGGSQIDFNKHNVTEWCKDGGKIKVLRITVW